MKTYSIQLFLGCNIGQFGCIVVAHNELLKYKNEFPDAKVVKNV